MQVTLQIKKKELDLIKTGVKKNEWRQLSEYNKKLLLKPRESDGKKEGNSDIKSIKFINGYSKEAETLEVEVTGIKVFRFSKDEIIEEDNFRASEGQFAIQVALGNIINN